MDKRKRQTASYLTGAEEYVSRIRGKYETMSDSERQVADYFLEISGDALANMNIKDVGNRCRVSVATIVRFCKTLGFKGFSEFKYSVQNGLLAPLGGDLRIGRDDDMGVVKQKVAEFGKRNINASIQHTDNKELERAVAALEKCRRIVVCATGTSSGVALAAANTFMFIGIPCQAPADSLTMLRTVSLCEKDDVVIGITNCGYIKDVVDSLKIARERRAVTICVTGMPDSLVTAYSDIVLACKFEDSSIALDIVTVSICQLLTLQTLQIGFLTRHGEATGPKLNAVHDLSEMARYAPELERIEKRRVRF